MKYPINYPFAGLFARIGITLIIRVNIYVDSDAKVLVATSTDIPGLVIEAETFIDIRNQVKEAIPNLLRDQAEEAIPNLFMGIKNLHKIAADVVFENHTALA